MLVPEVKQLRGEDGRCEESQEEKAAYGQVLDVLQRNAEVRAPPTPRPIPSPVETEEVKWEMGQKAILVCPGGFSFGASVFPSGK